MCQGECVSDLHATCHYGVRSAADVVQRVYRFNLVRAKRAFGAAAARNTRSLTRSGEREHERNVYDGDKETR